MKIFVSFVLSALILLLFTGCPYGYRYDEGHFPYDPVNFADANSIYDDYNMASPGIEGYRFLYFSSNRNSQGGEFDIIGQNFHMNWDREDGSLTIDDKPADWRDYDYTDSLFALMNTSANEFGPYSLMWLANESSDLNDFYNDLIIYSNDSSGHHDLKLVYYKGPEMNPKSAGGEYLGPEPVAILNSAGNDAYLTFYGPGFIVNDWGSYPQSITEALFCSDREGNFDLYRADVPGEASILDFLLSDGTATISALGSINSSYQDKCPYVNGDLLVFASDRPGGFGGFDLYYCQRNMDAWSDPVNFGQRVNSEFNEYRPIVLMYYEFQNDLMLYSSDRPGGMGGYDLYYVGIPKMIAGK